MRILIFLGVVAVLFGLFLNPILAIYQKEATRHSGGSAETLTIDTSWRPNDGVDISVVASEMRGTCESEKNDHKQLECYKQMSLTLNRMLQGE